MDRTILHSDMNSCFASIELLYHPELRGKPMAVAGDPQRRHGIVLAKDELAKRAGVKTAMPLWQAKRLCPEIIFVPPHYELYELFSAQSHEIYAEYTDLQEPYGLDECWLDISSAARDLKQGFYVADEIRQRIKSELGITVSIGVSWNKVFAKLGSDYKKPDAVTVIDRSNYRQLIYGLDVGELLYVGRSTKKRLNSLGINTIGELAASSAELVELQLGRHGRQLHDWANGLDDSPVHKEDYRREIKSVGNSTTPSEDLKNDEDIWQVVLRLSEKVAGRLRAHELYCGVVEISVRDEELKSFTRQQKLDAPTDTADVIAKNAMFLFRSSYGWEKAVRSIGVRVSDLSGRPEFVQLSLFDITDDKGRTSREKEQRLEKAVDEIRKRFGYGAAVRAGEMLCRKNM